MLGRDYSKGGWQCKIKSWENQQQPVKMTLFLWKYTTQPKRYLPERDIVSVRFVHEQSSMLLILSSWEKQGQRKGIQEVRLGYSEGEHMERRVKRWSRYCKLQVKRQRTAMLVRGVRNVFREIWRERQERQSMYSPNPGPVAGVLLTCAQLFPPNCAHKEAVNARVCRHRKGEAESRRSWEGVREEKGPSHTGRDTSWSFSIHVPAWPDSD